MKKVYVTDTNVLMQSPNAIENFEDNEVVIPLVVLEELDCLKKAEGDKGANARVAVRLLEKYRNKGHQWQWMRFKGCRQPGDDLQQRIKRIEEKMRTGR